MKNTTFTTVLLTFGVAISLHGQFTQVDFFKSTDKSAFYLYSIHKFNDANSLNLATLGFFENYKSNENIDFSEAGIQPTLFWNFSKHFSVGPSIYYNSISGFSQRISVRYVSKNERFLIALVPTIGHYQQDKEDNIYAETFAQFQFNIPIKKSLSFWVNGQFLNVWNSFKTHSRSFQQLRTGISFKKHQIGLGLDSDHYGPRALNRNAVGIYYRRIF